MTTGIEPRRAANGDETDVHGRARRYYCYLQRAGATAKIKQLTNRRERRERKTDVRRRMQEET